MNGPMVEKKKWNQQAPATSALWVKGFAHTALPVSAGGY